MKRTIVLLLSIVMALSLFGCGKKTDEIDLNNASWEEIVAAAKGTTVTFYGWGGDENRNNWLNTTVAEHLKQEYDITLEVVGMNIDDILAKLSGEKQANSSKGSIDMIWINGENFYSAKENGLLYGPFTEKLPNMANYIDLTDPETLSDFCMPIQGYEAPYAIMTVEAAQALKEAADEFRQMGYRIMIFDAYRPQSAVRHFVRWAYDEDDKRMQEEFYPEFKKKILIKQDIM